MKTTTATPTSSCTGRATTYNPWIDSWWWGWPYTWEWGYGMAVDSAVWMGLGMGRLLGMELNRRNRLGLGHRAVGRRDRVGSTRLDRIDRKRLQPVGRDVGGSRHGAGYNRVTETTGPVT